MLPKKIFLSDSQFVNIIWDDDTQQRIRIIDLRKYCPCATCQKDREHHQDWSHIFFTSDELKIVDLKIIGNYALSISWADGHNTGIYEFELLKKFHEEVI